MDAQITSNNIVLEDEIEYNKDEIKEAFKDLDVITNITFIKIFFIILKNKT